MDWHIAGAYVASCSCVLGEHWPIDGDTADSHGGCKGVTVFAIQEGTSDRAKLSGVSFAVVNLFPEDMDKDPWQMGLVVNETASEEQLLAIEEIARGKAGGPFGAIEDRIGNFLGTEHVTITIDRSAAPIVKIGSSIAFRFHPAKDDSGQRVSGGNTLYPWATDRVGGHAEGPPGRIFSEVWTPHFAEYARFDVGSD